MPTSITVIEIEKKEFSTQFRGYNTAEVHAYLELLASEMGLVQRENRELRDKVASLERELARAQAQEDRVKEAMLMAQKAADDTRVAARAESALILREAEAHRVTVIAETERLKADRDALVAQVQALFRSFLERLAPEESERKVAAG
jgi:cell division initiation protein